MKTQSLNTKFISISTLALFLMASVFVARAEDDNYNIQVISPKTSTAKIVSVRVDEKDGKLYIEGDVNRKLRQQFVTLGHIKVVVEDANGNVISEASGNYWPKRVNKDLNKASHFIVELPSVPPEGSVIKVERRLDEVNRY
jgi:hypothetical protein